MSVQAKVVVANALRNRIAWAKAQPNCPLWPNGPTPLQYVDGFIRKPGMGSYVLRVGFTTPSESQFSTLDDVRDLFETCEWTQMDPQSLPEGTVKPGNLYFFGELRTIKYAAYEAAIPLEELSPSEWCYVRIRRAAHGFELYHPSLNARPTKKIVAIVDMDGLVTWYPGRLLAPVNLGQAVVKQGTEK